jgi:hypothetical protein
MPVVARSLATIAVAGLALGLLASSARAQNLITNGSFEDTQICQGCYDYDYASGIPNDWLYSGQAVLINIASNSPWTTPSETPGYFGNQVAGIQFTGSISQTFAATGTGAFDVTWLDTGRPNYAVQDYTVSVLNDATTSIVSSETLTVTPGANFNPESLVADLVAGDTYTLTFQGLDSGGGDATAFIDNVDVSGAPAPMPGVLPLSLSVPVFAGFVWLHRRRMRGAA